MAGIAQASSGRRGQEGQQPRRGRRDRKKLLKQSDRLLAYRLLLRRGEWDVDRFFREIPASKWAELKIAHALIESKDDWIESVKFRGNKRPWTPPDFSPPRHRGRRRPGG